MAYTNEYPAQGMHPRLSSTPVSEAFVEDQTAYTYDSHTLASDLRNLMVQAHIYSDPLPPRHSSTRHLFVDDQVEYGAASSTLCRQQPSASTLHRQQPSASTLHRQQLSASTLHRQQPSASTLHRQQPSPLPLSPVLDRRNCIYDRIHSRPAGSSTLFHRQQHALLTAREKMSVPMSAGSVAFRPARAMAARAIERSLDHGALLTSADSSYDGSCHSSYLSTESGETPPARTIPSISSGIPTMGTSIQGRHLTSHRLHDKYHGQRFDKSSEYSMSKQTRNTSWKVCSSLGSCQPKRPGLLCVMLLCVGLLAGALAAAVLLSVGETSSGSTGDEFSSFLGSFTITNRPYDITFNNHSSSRFNNLASELQLELDRLFAASNVSSVYEASSVLRLEPLRPAPLQTPNWVEQGATRALVHVQLTDPLHEGAINIGTAFVEGMYNSHGRMWLGRFNIKIDDISFSPWDPAGVSGSAARWSDWHDWSACADCVIGSIQSRYRDCLRQEDSGSLVRLSSPASCLLLAQGWDVQQRLCECFNRSLVSNPPVASPQNPPHGAMSATPSISAHEIPHTSPAYPTPPEHRSCDQCTGSDVCVQLAGKTGPVCHPPRDEDDPLGCGGLCRLEVESCHRLSGKAYICKEEMVNELEQTICLNGQISSGKRCDGKIECFDTSDEADCGGCNKMTEFSCRNNLQCVSVDRRCDGTADCSDGSDEINCTVCLDKFRCRNGTCREPRLLCDGFPDCPDDSDEFTGCRPLCPPEHLPCRNGECVSAYAGCDGIEDCSDGSDEIDCVVVRDERTPRLITSSSTHTASTEPIAPHAIQSGEPILYDHYIGNPRQNHSGGDNVNSPLPSGTRESDYPLTGSTFTRRPYSSDISGSSAAVSTDRPPSAHDDRSTAEVSRADFSDVPGHRTSLKMPTASRILPNSVREQHMQPTLHSVTSTIRASDLSRDVVPSAPAQTLSTNGVVSYPNSKSPTSETQAATKTPRRQVIAIAG